MQCTYACTVCISKVCVPLLLLFLYLTYLFERMIKNRVFCAIKLPKTKHNRINIKCYLSFNDIRDVTHCAVTITFDSTKRK